MHWRDDGHRGEAVLRGRLRHVLLRALRHRARPAQICDVHDALDRRPPLLVHAPLFLLSRVSLFRRRSFALLLFSALLLANSLHPSVDLVGVIRSSERMSYFSG